MTTHPTIRNDDTYLHLSIALNARLVVPSNPKLQEQAGYRVPVVYSHACFARHIDWKSPDRSQDETGRAWDVLVLSAIALRYGFNAAGQAETEIESAPPGGESPERGYLRVAWLGDESDNPVVLIMLATETVRDINQAAESSSNQGGASHV